MPQELPKPHQRNPTLQCNQPQQESCVPPSPVPNIRKHLLFSFPLQRIYVQDLEGVLGVCLAVCLSDVLLDQVEDFVAVFQEGDVAVEAMVVLVDWVLLLFPLAAKHLQSNLNVTQSLQCGM